MALIEAVPNVSEARQPDIVAECASAVADAGAALLDVHTDVAHNRSVFTFAGAPEAVTASARALADVAVARMNLGIHTGVHPRVGVLDVVPFVPLAGASIEVCVALAREFGKWLAARHGVPVFLYEAAATAAHRVRLEAIRRGGAAALAERMHTDEWRPDFGPSTPHPTAGVTVVGARMPLIAFNVNLESDRLDVAKDIARAIRESSGGLPCVKALGLPLEGGRIAQVSMNLTDYRVTSVRRVFDAVVDEARARGVEVLESELVGLVPAEALSDDDARHARVRGFDGSQILERRLTAQRS
jgi:glutamate formiminotransferase